MTKINFYFNVMDRQVLLVRLARKALADSCRLLIYCSDVASARQLDQWLWTHDELSFLPHCLADAPEVEHSPIALTWPQGPVPHQEVLLNLDAAHPPIFSRFEKLLELVAADDGARTAGRERFRFYRERGYPLESFDMAGR